MNINKRIENLEDRLSIGNTLTPLQSIVMHQNCLVWYYGHTNSSQTEMVEFAKENSQTPEQYKSNLAVFLKLIDERINPRKVTEPTFTGRTYANET